MNFPQFGSEVDVQGGMPPSTSVAHNCTCKDQWKVWQVVGPREIVMILELNRQGLNVSVIARLTRLDRKTVKKYLDRGLEDPVYGQRELGDRLAERFRSYLVERLEAFPGLSARRLHREIKANRVRDIARLNTTTPSGPTAQT
jgi:hypothetical protein